MTDELDPKKREAITRAILQGRENAASDAVRAAQQSDCYLHMTIAAEVATLIAGVYTALNSEEPTRADAWLQATLLDAATLILNTDDCDLVFIVHKKEAKGG